MQNRSYGGGSSYGGSSGYGGGSRRGGGSRFGGGRSGGGRGGRFSRSGQDKKFNIGRGQPGAGLRAVDYSSKQLQPFQKDFYQGRIQGVMTEAEIQQWRLQYEMAVTGNNCPQPVRTFEEVGLPPDYLQKFWHLGFKAPTPIQSQGWPMALTGRDIVGIAQTGSGKTLAFILPAIIHAQGQPPLRRGDGPICLVVAPTRELACQIEEETKKYAPREIRVSCVYGGVPKRQQQYAIQRGVELLICTPGRLLDFLEKRTTNLERCTMLIFDEADRMLDMGFEPQIRAIVGQVRPDRQVLMWSATWPKEVQTLANDFLPNDRLMIKIGGDDRKAAENVTQIVYVVERHGKEALLQKTIAQFQGQKIIIFTATKRMADQLSRSLQRYGHYCDAIHGDKPQYDRDRVLNNFKTGRSSILVATDVASRGIHVKDIACVINYDFANNCDDYVHRIGRTGRAGSFGTAVTFFDPSSDAKKASPLVRLLRSSKQNVPPELEQVAKRGGGRYGGGGRRRGGRGRGRGGRRGGGRGRGGGSRFRPY